jgi:hypothetical protein
MEVAVSRRKKIGTRFARHDTRCGGNSDDKTVVGRYEPLSEGNGK